jgi:hypothetical protein
MVRPAPAGRAVCIFTPDIYVEPASKLRPRRPRRPVVGLRAQRSLLLPLQSATRSYRRRRDAVAGRGGPGSVFQISPMPHDAGTASGGPGWSPCLLSKQPALSPERLEIPRLRRNRSAADLVLHEERCRAGRTASEADSRGDRQTWHAK